MLVRSAKNKGKRLQNWVADQILNLFPRLHKDDDVRSAIMGETGEDVKISRKARKKFPYQVECKAAEGWSKLYTAFDQASSHGPHTPLLFVRSNRKPCIVCMEAEDFFRLLNEKENPGT